MYERYIDEKEAARITGLSRSWFQKRRWRGDGGPPYRKFGVAVRYPLGAFLAWIAEDGVRHHTTQIVPSAYTPGIIEANSIVVRRRDGDGGIRNVLIE